MRDDLKQRPLNGLTILDCYCGAGIGAVGAHKAGYNTVYAFDNNKHAVRNYNKNIAEVAHVVDAKTLDITQLPDADIITGGFPCKPWSVNGKREGESCSKNGNLAQKLIDIILYKEPKGFLIENVKGLVNNQNIPYFNKMLEQLNTKFNVYHKVIDCSEYGVPQKRERVFIVGVRKGIPQKDFTFPDKVEGKVSILEAIEDLPWIPDNKNNHQYYEKSMLRNDEKPYAHLIPAGGCWKDLPCEQMKKDFMKGAYYSTGGRTTYLAVVDLNKPARTIMSSPMGKNSAQIMNLKALVHPLDIDNAATIRRYTVREALRLQTVPDTFCFDSETPLNTQYERCSGIPSVMSYKLMVQLEEALLKGNI